MNVKSSLKLVDIGACVIVVSRFPWFWLSLTRVQGGRLALALCRGL